MTKYYIILLAKGQVVDVQAFSEGESLDWAKALASLEKPLQEGIHTRYDQVQRFIQI